MKHTIHLIIYIAALILITTSCRREDDLDDIFVGKTWYMMNGVFNGTSMPTKSFYTYDSSGYQLKFHESTFSGELSQGITYSGNWQGNGSNRTLTLTISSEPSATTSFDLHVYNIIKNATYYTGDSNELTIYKDKDNHISFSTARSSIPQTN